MTTDLLQVKEPAKILQVLEILNKGLPIVDWRIISSHSGDQGLNLVLGVEENSLKRLGEAGYKPYLGLTQLTLV